MGALFSKPKTPQVKPPAPMPDENDPGIMAAAIRKKNAITTRGGRASTILSDAGGGTSDFGSSKMGAG